MAPGTSRICVSCFKSMGIPLNSQNCSRWLTGKCRWGALGTVTTGVQLGRSKYLALLQCWPRNSTSDKKSNRFVKWVGFILILGKPVPLKGDFFFNAFFFLVILNTTHNFTYALNNQLISRINVWICGYKITATTCIHKHWRCEQNGTKHLRYFRNCHYHWSCL